MQIDFSSSVLPNRASDRISLVKGTSTFLDTCKWRNIMDNKLSKEDTIALKSLSDAELINIKNQERLRFKAIDHGLIKHRFFCRPCNVKILMLVDQGISYNQFYFGLSEVLDTFRNNPEWWVNFEVTRAHRQFDANPPVSGTLADALYGPHFEQFRFDQAGFDINDYDQVWFFGFNNGVDQTTPSSPGGPPRSLTDAELEILFEWMDKGGGVFCTGDHADLGESLCSMIPRARNMRKWSIGVPNPAPFNYGMDRHDTLLKGHNNPATAIDDSQRYTFDDESDDLAMNIRLRWYHHHHCHSSHHHHFHHWKWHYLYRKSPHPIFCGKDGPIRILPDHPHEGEVVVPSVLTDTLSFGAYSAREYPDYSGSPLKPEIIAWARVQDDHGANPANFKGDVNAKEFGAVGAYNGHCVNVGRVVVDSTWHHWFDVNLTGRMALFTDNPGNIESGDPRKLQGFNATASGQAALDKIKNYFRNVAIWLSPKAKLKCMSLRALWNCIYRFPLYADLSPVMPIWIIGHHAIDVLGHYAGQCNVKSWWPIILHRVELSKILTPELLKQPVDAIDSIDKFVLGGILQKMLIARDKDLFKGETPDDKQLEKLAIDGANQGFEELIGDIESQNKSNSLLIKGLQREMKSSQSC